jgi:glycosyltransferase involved in cell wall biosynthesis
VRVLQINKFGTRSSGADNYFLDVSRELADAGHELGALCMRPSEVDSRVQVFEVPDIDFHNTSGPVGSARAARRVVYSNEAKKIMATALSRFRPDAVHLHNYAHQLSSSVVEVARDHGVPLVATAHDYKFVCPSYTALRNGEICFRCAHGSTIGCVTGRCLHGSLPWSAVAALEAATVRRSGAIRLPNLILAPSDYMAARLRDSWLAQHSVEVRILRNPVAIPTTRNDVAGRLTTGIYVGRLAPEKGLDDLVRAVAAERIPLLVVGDGSERHSLEQLASETGAPVEFLGHATGEALSAAWRRAGFFAMTPTWPENAPLALLEAMARGLPAVVTDVGGLAEIVRILGGGYVADSGDIASIRHGLRAAVSGAVSAPDEDAVEEVFGWPQHIRALTKTYEELRSATA